MNRYLLNPCARSEASYPVLLGPAELKRVRDFYRDRTNFPPTPLREVRGLASRLGIGKLLIKDESNRFQSKAFKVVGVQYAMERLRQSGQLNAGVKLVCATDGNHGWAVAHVARQYGHSARIYLPQYTVRARIEAIKNQGAEIVVLDSGYDEAVQAAAQYAEQHAAIVVSDTSWPGYEEIPCWIMAGYTQIMNEASEQWLPEPAPDVILVQVGVGGLAGAVVSWLCQSFGDKRPFAICCEPSGAACLLESFRVGRPVQLEGDLPTVMAGLRCGQVSTVAWPTLAHAADAFLAIDDEWSAAAMLALANPVEGDPAILAGESGACGVASLMAIMQDENLCEMRIAAGLGPKARVMVINTEGITDPEFYGQAVAEIREGSKASVQDQQPIRNLPTG